MFYLDLKNILDTIIAACVTLKKIRDSISRKRIGLDLLEMQILFSRVQAIGKELLELGGSDPENYLPNLPKEKHEEYSTRIHILLGSQQRILHRLYDLLESKEFLDVFGEDFHRRTQELIGNKQHDLLGVASAIEFYFVFGPLFQPKDIREQGQEIAMLQSQGDLLRLIYSDKELTAIDLKAAEANLSEFESSAKNLKKIISENYTFDECASMSKEVSTRIDKL